MFRNNCKYKLQDKYHHYHFGDYDSALISSWCLSSALFPSEQGFIDKASINNDNMIVVNFIITKIDNFQCNVQSFFLIRFLHYAQRSVYGVVASRRVLCTIHIVVSSFNSRLFF